MMNTHWIKSVQVAAGFLVAGLLAAASQAAVLNPSFALPNDLADASATNDSIPDWILSQVYVGGGGAVGVYDPESVGNPGTDGDNVQGSLPGADGQVAYIVFTSADASRGFYQRTDIALVAGQHYDLTVSMGTYGTRPSGGYRLELFAWDGTVFNESSFQTQPLASEANAMALVANGGWVTRTIGFDVLPDSPYLGQSIAIRLSGTYPAAFPFSETFFDEVSLTAGPIPEPASLGLLGVGMVAMLRRRK
jgi:hypothetical protein